MTEDGFEKIYNISLKFLSYRPRSEKEVRNHLKIKNETGNLLIDKVIQKLKEQNFINDSEFAKWWIEQRLMFKPRSSNLIKRELLQKGIDKEIIDAQFSIFSFQFSNELENAQRLITKKFSRYKGVPSQAIYRKMGRFLAGKGFDWEVIKIVVDGVVSKRV
ncbi:RecX family transcriptional regulator [Patescibacteria group bacterium]|nr:RecX family transcriptional regulator [Patescibacteria group bacterium]MCL5010294.1 RecX family transcriptional regulator [Patescibacteria group bacterium]